MPKYIYQSLDKSTSEFRLLRISKHPLIDLPQCSLQKYSLTDCPEYTALSYTWGEPTPTYRVAIEGANIEVRQNLFDFLHAYVTEPWGVADIDKPVFYWIDQICINQEDLVERSDQVSIMGKIYKQANMVLVWLGCELDMIETARQLRDEEDDGLWAIRRLLAHPYFSRIWVVQEIVLSVNSPLVVCGGIALDPARIHSRHFMNGPILFLEEPVWAINFEHGRLRNMHTLERCISLHCAKGCHDPRDKVYGLLGLTSERWRVRVDYTKEVLEVYFDAVAALCEELFDLRDPECVYPKRSTDTVSLQSYRNTLYILARAMGISWRHLEGLHPFLEYIQAVYLSTKIRNVQYTYTGRICTTVREQSSFEQTIAPEKEEVEASWGSVTATRRNPLLRDIIPEMGLELVSTTAESTDGRSCDFMLGEGRWWCRHEGKITQFQGH